MVPWYQKLAIGATGALCLGLLKLIGANFYLGAADRNVAIGAYMTYGAYLVLGMAVGFFFCEDSDQKDKTFKSAFLMGLLAPSILIAIVSKPLVGQPSETNQPSAVQTLSESLENIFIPTAYAQTHSAPLATTPIEVLSKPNASTSLWTGVKSALGANDAEQYLYVIGKTDNERVAQRKAADINVVLHKSTQPSLVVKIIKPDAGHRFYLAIGDTSSQTIDVNSIKQSVTNSALSVLTGTSTASDKIAAEVMLKGHVISLNTLAHGNSNTN